MLALEATIAATNYIAVALFIGQLVTAGFLLPEGHTATLRCALLLWARAFLLLFLTAACLALLVQGAKLQRGFPSTELLWRYLTATQSGKIWLVREFYGVVLLSAIWPLARKNISRKVICLVAVLALPLGAARSLTSHAAAVRDGTVLALSADAFHLIATALWAGGLVAVWRIFYLDRRNVLPAALKAQLVQRFSNLALASVFLLLITGAYQTWIQVGSFNAVLNTQYGNVLVLKLALFFAMIALGALNFWSTRAQLWQLAKINSPKDNVSQRAATRIGAESLLGLAIFCITGLLTVLPPGVHALHQLAITKPPANIASTLPYAAKIEPAEGASVKILSPSADQVFVGDQVPLKFALTKGKRGTHVHAYIDGELMGMFESTKGTLNGIQPGGHTLELRVVAEDHQTELDAMDRVQFIVK
jgi:putative copper export protein